MTTVFESLFTIFCDKPRDARSGACSVFFLACLCNFVTVRMTGFNMRFLAF